LKPAGHFIVSTPYHGWLKNVVLALSGKMDNHFTALWDGGHIKFWSRETLSRLLRSKGLPICDSLVPDVFHIFGRA
jgi:2-polyprenyl-6-hydroxyphenyl methylase/3-demethylubiquinone-9 3-methyltransferase